MSGMARARALPNRDTFSVGPIGAFIERNINRSGLVADPFARNSLIADLRNDLNPHTLADFHMDAVEFLSMLVTDGRRVTTVLFDPPYSPRQITESYAAAGLTATMQDTQNARFYRRCREVIEQLLQPGGVVLSFGWNSVGMGARWKRLETLIVCHGGAHNDTICCADTREPTS